MQVLLVDDDAFSRKLMGMYLKPIADLAVDMAAGGQECLDKVAQSPPDLILMDCQMPGMDGFETVTRLRSSGYQGIILALTGNSDAQTLERCSQVGMNGHMGKPVDPATLRERILTALGVSQPAPPPAPPAPVAPPPSSTPAEAEDPLARARSIAAAANNPALLGRLVTSFIKSTADGMEQLRQAAESGDHAGVSAVAHRLRGSSGTFGAMSFSRAAGTLEDTLKERPLSECPELVRQLQEMWAAMRTQLENSGGTS